MGLAWRTIARLRTAGVRETGRVVAKNVVFYGRRYYCSRVDRRYGIDTSGRHELESLDTVGGNKAYGVYFEPSPEKTVNAVLRHVVERVMPSPEQATFIDYGSGKGRVIVLAAFFPFRRVVGVEFSKELHDISTRNVEKILFGSRDIRCRNVDSVLADATEYELDDGDLVVFFFNPFLDNVFRSVLKKITEKYTNTRCNICIVYYHPQREDLIEETGYFTKVYRGLFTKDFCNPQGRETSIWVTEGLLRR